MSGPMSQIGKRWDDDLIKYSLLANASIQDIMKNHDDITHDRLSAAVDQARNRISVFREKLDNLDCAAKLSDKDTDRLLLEGIGKKHRKELSRLNTALRQTNLASLTIIEKREKKELLQQSSSSSTRQRVIKDKKSAAKANSAITESLINVSQMMSSQLTRSGDTIDTLVNSSSAITSVGDELKSMHGHIKNARTLLTKYARREVTDKLFIVLSMVFFFATVLYIIKKRYWYTVTVYSSSTTPTDHSETVLEL